MLLSIVSPVYNEESCLEEFYKTLIAVVEDLNFSFEIILVNDGSSDQSADILDRLAANDSRVQVIHLARNFGHQAALCAGLEAAQGDAVIVMDSDLQDNPWTIPHLIQHWKEGFDVVYTIRTKRKECLALRFFYSAFYRLFRLISEVDMPLDSGDFCLMDRVVVNAIMALPERNRFLRGLRAWVGFRQVGIEVERSKRYAGESKYSMRALFKLASDGIFSFSWVPLRVLTLSGLCMVVASFLYLAVILCAKIVGSFELPGWTSVVLLIVSFGGIQLLALGLIGEYIGRMFSEIKHRPVYIVARSSQRQSQRLVSTNRNVEGNSSKPQIKTVH